MKLSISSSQLFLYEMLILLIFRYQKKKSALSLTPPVFMHPVTESFFRALQSSALLTAKTKGWFSAGNLTII